MKPGTIYFLVIFLAIGLFSCKSKNAKTSVLPFDTMKVVILDLMNAENWNNFIVVKDTTLRKSKNNLKLYQQVFSIHHIKKEEFYYSYQYYEQHPDKMKILLDSLSVFADRQKNKIKKIGFPVR